jgi:histone deacetylase 6
MEAAGLLEQMVSIESRKVTDDELTLVHTEEYVNEIKALLSMEFTDEVIMKKLTRYNSVRGNRHTLNAALVACGSTVELVDQIRRGIISRGVAIVRPPGHHARPREAMGFCFFNNVAVAAVKSLSFVKPIVIVDFDVHHGNGTQEIVVKNGNKDLHYISCHRNDSGFYPMTGSVVDHPNIVNIPYYNTLTNDRFVNEIFGKQIIPRLEEIKPMLIIVSAGFDAGVGDPLGECEVTPQGFGKVTQMMLKVCNKMAVVLEGGYNLGTVAQSLAECTDALINH